MCIKECCILTFSSNTSASLKFGFSLLNFYNLCQPQQIEINCDKIKNNRCYIENSYQILFPVFVFIKN
jgi:hypothetical protein